MGATTSAGGRVECKRCGTLVPVAEYRRGEPSRWVDTGPVWVNAPIPVFQHGGPTACHPSPIGMVPNGYWQNSGYWTAASSWVSGRPATEEGCAACARVVKASAAADRSAERARAASGEALQAVERAAAADVDADLHAVVEAYATAEVERVRAEERRDRLHHQVSEQDARASGSRARRSAVARSAPDPPRPEAAIRGDARAAASAAAETERVHQRRVNGNRERYGTAKALTAQHGRLEAFCAATRPGPGVPVLALCVAAAVAVCVLLQRSADWVPGIVDAVHLSRELRDALSAPLGALLGVGIYFAIVALRRRLHRAAVRRATAQAATLRDRIGCGSATCDRCARPPAFRHAARMDRPLIAGLLVLGCLASAAFLAVAVGDGPVKLQRVAAVIPDRLKDDCRQRPVDGPIEVVCTGPAVRRAGLTVVFFQFGNPSYDTYGKGVFEESSTFTRCNAQLRSMADRPGGWTPCAGRAAVWTDETVVLGGATGRRADDFARLQYRYGGERVYGRG